MTTMMLMMMAMTNVVEIEVNLIMKLFVGLAT